VLWKYEGETPLACIERAREGGKIPSNEKATYAGRLDPMAEGVLLVLTGESVHEKEKYLKLSKEYEVEVLFGVATDTGDILGKIQEIKPFIFSNDSESPRTSSKTRPDISESLGGDVERKIQDTIVQCVGTFTEEYPAYSSRTVDGKPLFAYAREGVNVEMPIHEIIIHSIVLENMRMMKLGELQDEIVSRIAKVKGDFRQEEIVKKWRDVVEQNKDAEVLIATIVVLCESGAYMRVLAEKIGKLVDTPALAYRIIRTKLGTYERN